MKNTSPKLQLVGEVRSPARKVILTRLAKYPPSGGGRMSFFAAHRKAQEQNSSLISIRSGVRLIHALSNPDAYTKRKETQNPKGVIISSPGLEMLLEGADMNSSSVLEIPAFWSGGLLISSGGRQFGSEIVMGPSLWCENRNVFQVPKNLENAAGISLIYEPGTWTFQMEGNDVFYLPKENSRPVWILDSSGQFDLSVLDKGTDLAKDENPPEITIFIFSRGKVEWVGPVLCTLSPNDHKSIRISALLPPESPMGAIMESPMD